MVVVGGGNLGMAWFPSWPTRPTIAQLDARWPGLVPWLALTAGVGAVLAADDDGSAGGRRTPGGSSTRNR